jgi:hypothetical protein
LNPTLEGPGRSNPQNPQGAFFDSVAIGEEVVNPIAELQMLRAGKGKLPHLPLFALVT